MGASPIPTRSLQARAGWALPSLVVVEATSTLAPEPANGHHLAQECGSSEPWLFERLEQHISNMECGVEPNEVEQCEWPHRIARPQHHADVDVLFGREFLLDQLHGRHWIEEVHAQHAVWPMCGCRQLNDGNRTGVARQYRVWWADLIELRKQLLLKGQVLNGCFNHQVAIGEVFQPRCPPHPAAYRLLVC